MDGTRASKWKKQQGFREGYIFLRGHNIHDSDSNTIIILMLSNASVSCAYRLMFIHLASQCGSCLQGKILMPICSVLPSLVRLLLFDSSNH